MRTVTRGSGRAGTMIRTLIRTVIKKNRIIAVHLDVFGELVVDGKEI
jgi:hypothetical protein